MSSSSRSWSCVSLQVSSFPSEVLMSCCVIKAQPCLISFGKQAAVGFGLLGIKIFPYNLEGVGN